jgi:hypothetical protein
VVEGTSVDGSKGEGIVTKKEGEFFIALPVSCAQLELLEPG